MREPTLEPLLGRYEYKSGTSDKFWTISYDTPFGMYLAEWGRNGRPPQNVIHYNGRDALKKVQEKIAKGYRLVEPMGERAEATERVKKKRAERVASAGFMKLLDEEIPIDAELDSIIHKKGTKS